VSVNAVRYRRRSAALEHVEAGVIRPAGITRSLDTQVNGWNDY